MAAAKPRRLTADERAEIRAVVAAMRTRAADMWGSFDEVDLGAYQDQLEVLRVVAETRGPAHGERHLVLDNCVRAARSVPAGRLRSDDGRALTLYEDPDWGLLTEIRWGRAAREADEPPPGTEPDAIEA